jgi:hypothetical protein
LKTTAKQLQVARRRCAECLLPFTQEVGARETVCGPCRRNEMPASDARGRVLFTLDTLGPRFRIVRIDVAGKVVRR